MVKYLGLCSNPKVSNPWVVILIAYLSNLVRPYLALHADIVDPYF